MKKYLMSICLIFSCLFAQIALGQEINDKIKSEDEGWAIVQKTLSLKDYQYFIKLFPQSKYIKSKGYTLPSLQEDRNTISPGFKKCIFTSELEDYDLMLEKIGRGEEVDWGKHKSIKVIETSSGSEIVYPKSGRVIKFYVNPNEKMNFQLIENNSLRYIKGFGLVKITHNNKTELYGFNMQ